MRKYITKCYLLAIFTLLISNIIMGQPSRDNFNILFENNYNDNQSGKYGSSDFVTDWRTEPGSSPSGSVEIISDDASHQKVMRAYYPTGTIGPTATHGYTWYSYLQNKGDEAYFSYDIRFKSGFEWVHGGKIPGLVGGSVTSGQDPSLNNGFSTRMMWKGGGNLVFYVYHYDQTSNYGDTYFWEGFKFTTGKWYNVTIRVVLNSISNGSGIANGILEGYVDGKLYFQKTDFRFRMTETIKIERMYLCSFFGGDSPEWFAARDESIDFDNFVCFTYSDKAINVPRGRQQNSSGTLLHPYYSFGTSTVPALLESPSALNSPNQTSSTIDLAWSDNSSSEDGFLLYRSLSATEGFTEVDSCDANETSCTDNSLSSGRTYYYKLRAYNKTGYSEYTPVLKIATKAISNSASNYRTVYIDPSNSDDVIADGSIDHPFDSWSKISWKEGFSYLQKRGTTATVDILQVGANRITIGSYGEGPLPVIKSQTSNYLISGFEKSGIHISNVNLQAVNAVSCIYFLGNSSDSLIVEHCNLTANANAIKIIDGVTLLARYNTISSKQEGIFSTASDNKIYYNIFTNCNNAVNIMSNSSKAEIFNNVFVDNVKSVSVTYSDLTLYNNIFYMTRVGEVALIHGKGNITSDNNIFYPEQPGFISVAGEYFDKLDELQKSVKIDLESFTSNPEFVDIANNNFRLLSSSPAVNSGRKVNLNEDMSGKKVPLFGVPDIGAFEFDGNLALNPGEEEDINLKVYPNPSTGPVVIEVKIADGQLAGEPQVGTRELQVLDITGKTIVSKQLQSSGTLMYEEQIDLSSYRNGLYFVVVHIADKMVRSKILISK